MCYAIYRNEGGEYGLKFKPELMLYVIKLPCAIALHLVLYPQIDQGLRLMKFANNSPDSFVTHGSYIAFLLGFIGMLTAVVAETVNIYLLSN